MPVGDPTGPSPSQDRATGSRIAKWVEIRNPKKGFRVVGGGGHPSTSPLRLARQDRAEVGSWGKAGANGRGEHSIPPPFSPLTKLPAFFFFNCLQLEPTALLQPYFPRSVLASAETPRVQSCEHCATAQRDRVTNQSQALPGMGREQGARTHCLGDNSQVPHPPLTPPPPLDSPVPSLPRRFESTFPLLQQP